ncbi:MAG TPA: DUF5668 domain-containing protein [Candidatus Paceibacterota bacterium]
MDPQGNTCPCKCHKVGPILIIVFGVVFLLGTLNIITEYAVMLIWPIIVIVAGVKKLVGQKCGCCSASH